MTRTRAEECRMSGHVAPLECSGSRDHQRGSARAAPVEEGLGYHRQARVENAFFRYKSIIAMAFAPGVEEGGTSRRALRAVS